MKANALDKLIHLLFALLSATLLVVILMASKP